MSRILLVLYLILFPFILADPPYATNSEERTAPVYPLVPVVYDINLDDSYEDQWTPIIEEYKDSILAYAVNVGLVGQIPPELVALVNYDLISSYNKEFADEIQVIANLLNITFNECTVLNFFYEFTAQCTSIVVQDDQGNIYHGRNLDFYDAADLSNMVFKGRYFKNGELLYEAISVAGYTGLITGLKPHSYSLSINQHLLSETETPSAWDQISNVILDISQASKGFLSPPYLVRQAFQTATTYDELVDILNSTETISRVFYIIAGVDSGEGLVMTKFRTFTQNITTLNVDDGIWYVAQTNYIGNATDPRFDNRATAARDFLDAIGQANITPDLLLNQVMSVFPVFNNQTIHTTVMQPQTDYFNTTIWGW